ncbi:MAG: hypothetical protein RL468_2293 [Pseudomonadota bacterium]
MKRWISFRQRLLLASIVPVAVAVVSLIGLLMFYRINDYSRAYQQGNQILLQQIASASEYPIVQNNQEQLEYLLKGALRHTGVLSVTLFDRNGDVLDRQANADWLARANSSALVEVWSEPVRALQVRVGEKSSSVEFKQADFVPLGKLVLEVSRESVLQQNRQIILLGVGVGLFSLLLSVLLARRLSSRVMVPVEQLREAESALAEALQRMQLAMKVANIGVWEWDIQADRVHWDQRQFLIYGCQNTPEFQPSNAVWQRALHPDDLATQEANVQALLQGQGDSNTSEFRIIRYSDGAVRHIEMAQTLLRGEDGLPSKLIGTNVDITERKLAEAAAEKSRLQLQLITNQARVRLAQYDDQLRYRLVNQAFADQFGLRIDEVMKMHPREVLGLTAYQFVEEKMKRALAGEELEFESFLTDIPAGPRVSFVRYRPERNEQGRVIGFFSASLDITDLKAAEAALRESEAKFRDLWESNRDAQVLCFPSEFRLTGGNEAAVTLFGARDADHLATLKPQDLSPIRQPDGELSSIKAQRMIDRAITEGSNFFEWTHWVSGKEVPCEVSLTRLSIKGMTGVQATVRDITLRKQAEAKLHLSNLALQEKKAEAEAANQAKLQFIAAASHDLRQPTHALGLFVSRLGQLVDDPKTLELVNDLGLALHDMQNLLDEMLDFSRLQEKTFQPRLQAIDLQELLEILGASFSMQAASKGLSLKVRARAAWVLSDPVLLRQIVLNLISNALRYTKQGRILVACRSLAQGSRLRLEVWDTGIGIAAEHQHAIFKEYFQLSNAERDRRKGLGLGLSIVQRAADLLGHPVKLRSVPGRGSCFSIELPCTQRVSEPAPSPSPQSLIQGLSVLLVEDDPMVVKASEALLSSWACHLRSAENLDSALRLIEEGFSPDILISDYRLPGDFDGIAVLQHLQRACGTEIPAVLITGDTEENIIQRAKSAGLTVMHKPLRPAKLRSLLKNLSITAQI